MKQLVLVLAAVAALAVPASAATPKQQGPGAFVMWELHQVSAGRWPQLWKRIHPAQRRNVKQVLYVLCNAQLDTGWKLTDMRVTAVKSVRAPVPGTKVGPVRAKAVTVRMVLHSSDGRTTTQKQTVNVFRVKGVWYSALTAAQYKAYKADKCLGLSPSTG